MNKRGLINFQIDHLTLNIGYTQNLEEDQNINIINLKYFLEYAGLNDTNTNQLFNQDCSLFPEALDITKEHSISNHDTYGFFWGKYRIMRIEFISANSLLTKNLNYKYNFRITFYGTLFALDRIQKLSAKEFINPFIDDIKTYNFTHSISRIDICSDISGVSTKSIKKGIQGDKKHKKTISNLNTDPITNIPETIYYGKKKSNEWMARIYNKLLDISKKGKESLFWDYLDYEKITRLEIQIKSSLIQKLDLNIFNCFDLNFLLSVYKKTLSNKYIEFKIVNFIEKEMSKRGYKSFSIKNKQITHNKLSQTTLFQRFIRNGQRLIDEYEATRMNLIDILCRDLKEHPNSKEKVNS